MQEREWTKKEIERSLDLDETVTYSSNPEMLSHVWENLFSNAIKFCPAKGGIIRISCKRFPGGVSVTVSDNGPGMDEETVKHIFEAFYQGDSSHKAEGNGLGLPLVKRIVDLHGGRCDVTSAPGEGATFTVTLPDQGKPSDK